MATSLVDAVIVGGDAAMISEFTRLRAELLADESWKTFFLRSLKYDCQSLKLRRNDHVKFREGGRLFLDSAMVACIVKGELPSDGLIAARDFYVSLLRHTADEGDAAHHAGIVVAECSRLFGYCEPSPHWSKILDLRRRVQDANFATVKAAGPVQSGATLQRRHEQAADCSDGYACIFSLEDSDAIELIGCGADF
jgi:hypothetical protein